MRAVAAAHALHAVARMALRLASPLRAKRIVDAVGRRMPRLLAHEARAVANAIDSRGTCLSRAMTVAAMVPGAAVVIGVDPLARRPLFGHAWVELAGQPLRPGDVDGFEIARLVTDQP